MVEDVAAVSQRCRSARLQPGAENYFGRWALYARHYPSNWKGANGRTVRAFPAIPQLDERVGLIHPVESLAL